MTVCGVGNTGVAGHDRPPVHRPGNSRIIRVGEAGELGEGSGFGGKTLGEGVWRHYRNYGSTEQGLFEEVVTDYERRRMFERG